MRKEALLFFAATQIAILFGISVGSLVALVAITATVIAVKAMADGRRIEPASWATLAAAVISSILVPWVMETQFARGADFMVELELDGRKVEGRALNWKKNRVTVLGRDGQLWDFHPSKGKNYKKTAPKFAPWTPAEMRADLLQEFGKRFDVSGTGHYLVVHPRGQKDKWAMRFEEIYRKFTLYFSTRGFRIRNPSYPLVAVVFPTQREFLQHAARTGNPIGPGVLGYYSPQSNRVLLFDMTSSSHHGWHTSKEIIIHEVVHQAAFNTGVHSRMKTPPRWVAEGLGTMFEAPGVWGSRRHFEQKDRINRTRYERFLAHLPNRKSGALAQFVSSERRFKTNPDAAYAEAWALTFFLSETRPRQYAQYMAKVARGEGAGAANSVERLKAFTDVFGSDLGMLEAKFLRFYRDLQRESRS